MLCEDQGDEYEMFCMNHEDEGKLISFFRDLNQEDNSAA